MSVKSSPWALPGNDLSEVVEHTRDLWKDCRGDRFFVTGGTGFFGRWIVESWIRANEALSLDMTMMVLTRDPDGFLASAPHLAGRDDLQLWKGDVKTFPFPEGSYDHVIHAATTAARLMPARETLDTTIFGTRRVLEFARQCELQNLLLTSSGAVYGKQPEQLENIPEDYPGAPEGGSPSSAYGEAKRTSEIMGLVHAEEVGFALKIARCFSFIGPLLPLDSHFAIGNFIRDAMRGNPIRIESDGRVIRSYLYASDLVTWLWTILFRGKSERPYNVGSPEAISLPDLARLVAQQTKSDSGVVVAGKHSGNPINRYVPETSRAQEELGLAVRVPLDEAIRRTISQLRSVSAMNERASV